MKSKKKNAGKIFEEEIRDSIPADFYVERYKDDTAGFYGVSNPADYRIYKYPLLFLLELKSHKGKSLPLSKISENQIKGLQKAVQYKGIYGGFIINFRELEETYFLAVGQVCDFIKLSSRKSIPVDYCRQAGVLIPQKKKRVRYSYDIGSLLKRYYGGVTDGIDK